MEFHKVIKEEETVATNRSHSKHGYMDLGPGQRNEDGHQRNRMKQMTQKQVDMEHKVQRSLVKRAREEEEQRWTINQKDKPGYFIQ
ncbi:hypothetical protein C5167_011499 [Papaver somniferum]|uniref:Uncharacterized protein n=1 Tax=Papaver somniferum TaxID=3469 RepID=A0A4Y7K4P9_PAPSO|nr:hypothetical protein C5167_011499 [Papaver somniferum]